MPVNSEREDVLAIAQTGTGKTAAFVIPILHTLQERGKVSGRADG
ncbi:MAG: DEAD/DEAH box helicase [Flavobacteriales bacterium]